MYFVMSDEKPEETADSAQGATPDNPPDQTGPPVVTVTVKVHWPGHP
jgi:hypothetical protein